VDEEVVKINALCSLQCVELPALQQAVNGVYLFTSARRTASSWRHHSNGINSKNLTSVTVLRNKQSVVTSDDTVPSLYLLNAAGLTKLHAIEHLATDLTGNGIDLAIITETHFKSKHSDGTFNIPGFTLYRRDRAGRRGGGVATYVRSTLQSTPWTPSTDDKLYELQWTKVGNCFVGALYHPPKPQYHVGSLLDYVDANVHEINHTFLDCIIILAGDFNQISDVDVIERTGLTPIVHQPTRGANVLDRIYVSQPCYSSVRVVTSIVRSDHKAVVTYTDKNKCA